MNILFLFIVGLFACAHIDHALAIRGWISFFNVGMVLTLIYAIMSIVGEQDE